MAWWLNVVGLVLQVGGTLLAVFGLGQTWRAYASDRGFVAAILAPVLTAGPVVRLRQALGWAQSAVATPGPASGRATANDATAYGIPGPLGPGDPEQKFAALDARTRQLFQEVAQVKVRHDTDIGDVRRSLDALGAGVAAEASARAAAVRDAAIGGVLVAARGLALVALGLVLQLVAVGATPAA